MHFITGICIFVQIYQLYYPNSHDKITPGTGTCTNNIYFLFQNNSRVLYSKQVKYTYKINIDISNNRSSHKCFYETTRAYYN